MKDKQAREVQKLTRRIAFRYGLIKKHHTKMVEDILRAKEICDQKMDMAPSIEFEIAMNQCRTTIESIGADVKSHDAGLGIQGH